MSAIKKVNINVNIPAKKVNVGSSNVPIEKMNINSGLKMGLNELKNYAENTIQNVEFSRITDIKTGSSLFLKENLEYLANLTSIYSASNSSGNADEELAGTEYKNLEGFDNHIEEIVNFYGKGTKEAALATIISLADYTGATGKRIKYIYGEEGRQDPENPKLTNGSNFGMDCSGLVFWTLKKAGYKLPTYAQTDLMYDWASKNNYLSSIEGGNSGDLIITQGRGHVMMIIGVDNDEYYIAEETLRMDDQNGFRIAKYTIDELKSLTYEGNSYARIDMNGYYENDENKL